MSLRKRRDWTRPLTKKEIKNALGDWKLVPAKVVLEIVEFETLYKSPYSLSFYSKRKYWNYTEPDTIRLSNHWNFISRHTGEKVHCKTNIEIPDNTWIKAKYDDKNVIFVVEEIYENIYFTKTEYQILIKSFGDVNFKPSEEVINRGIESLIGLLKMVKFLLMFLENRKGLKTLID